MRASGHAPIEGEPHSVDSPVADGRADGGKTGGCARVADADRASAQKLRGVGADEVEKTIDAVAGATWGTRNRIMAGLFQRDMRRHADDMPAFAPPGEDIAR